MKARRWLTIGVLVVAMPLIGSCGGSRNQTRTTEAGTGKTVISALDVKDSSETTDLVIVASQPPKYTVFKLVDPLRLVIDIENAVIDGVQLPIAVKNGTIGEITATDYEENGVTTVRIFVGFDQAAEYNVESDGNNLVASVQRLPSSGAQNSEDALTQMLEEAPDKPSTVAAEPAVPAADPDDAPSAVLEEDLGEMSDDDLLGDLAQDEMLRDRPKAAPEPTPAPAAPSKASALTQILTESDDAGTSVVLVFNGSAPDYLLDQTTSPPRLFIDFVGVKSQVKKKEIQIRSTEITAVRVGNHTGKIRVVFDGASRSILPEYKVSAEDERLVVHFDPIPDEANAPIANALPGEPAAEPDVSPEANDLAGGPPNVPAVIPPELLPEEPIDEGGTDATALGPVIKMTGLDFKQVPKASRIIIKTERPTNVQVNEESPTRVVMELGNTRVPTSLRRALDTSAFDSPISVIRAYTTDGAYPTARVEVQLKESAPYQYEQEGNVINFDFERIESSQPVTVKQPSTEQDGDFTTAEPEEENGATATPDVATIEAQNTSDTLFGKRVKRYKGRPINLEFQDADVKQVLRLIAEVAKLNVIAGDDVKGTITVSLRQVPWDEALDIILATKGLGQERSGNIVRVAPVATLTAERQARIAAQKALIQEEPLQTRLIQINYATAQDVLGKVQPLLSDRGKVNVDQRTNKLIVEDVADFIDKAEALIAELDTPTPQVLIEARIVEVSLDFSRNLGVQWGGAVRVDPATGNPTGLFFPNRIGVGGGFDQLGNPIFGQATTTTPNFVVNLPAASPGAGVGISLGSIDGTLDLDLRLTAIEQEGKGKVISSPKVTTIDNQEATITQGVRIPFETVSAQGTQVQFVDAALKLIVTPHITGDDGVFMRIRVEKNAPSTVIQSINGVPGIETNEAETEVLVKDGDTTVIGGVYTINRGDTRSGVPWFRKLPLIGWLFRNRAITNRRQELLVFVTPKIVRRKFEASSVSSAAQ